VGVTARAIFQGHIDGLTASSLTPESLPIGAGWVFDAAVGQIDPVSWAQGTTQLAVPAGATMIVLIPPSTNVTPIVLKGATGDIGIPASPNSATVIALAQPPQIASPPTLFVTLTAAVSGVRLIWL
jgi:hypothetical protein